MFITLCRLVDKFWVFEACLCCENKALGNKHCMFIIKVAFFRHWLRYLCFKRNMPFSYYSFITDRDFCFDYKQKTLYNKVTFYLYNKETFGYSKHFVKYWKSWVHQSRKMALLYAAQHYVSPCVLYLYRKHPQNAF